MRHMYKIVGIYQLDGKTPKEDVEDRIGLNVRSVYPIEIGYSMRLAVIGAHGEIQTSRVQEIKDDGGPLLVTTRNTVYALSKQ